MKNLNKLFFVFALILFVNLSLKAVSIDTTKFIGQWGGHIEFAERLEAINIIIKNYNHVFWEL